MKHYNLMVKRNSLLHYNYFRSSWSHDEVVHPFLYELGMIKIIYMKYYNIKVESFIL